MLSKDTKTENKEGEEKVTRRPWHRPSVTRIELKRTMWGSGPYTDEAPAFTAWP